MWNNFSLKWSAALRYRIIVPTLSLMFFSSDSKITQRRMVQDSKKWIITGVLLQLFSIRNQYVLTYSINKADDKLLQGIKNSELNNRVGLSSFGKFEYPKEETTHGVGYGHHLHPFYYQGNPPLYSCAIQGEWHPIVQHAYHSNVIQNFGRSDSIHNLEENYNSPSMPGIEYISSKNTKDKRPITPEHHFKQFPENNPTMLELKRFDISHHSLNSLNEDGLTKKHTIKYSNQNMLAQEKLQDHNYNIKQPNTQIAHSPTYSHYKLHNKTSVPLLSDSRKIPVYLIPPPPPPPTHIVDAVIQLQHLLPIKRQNVRSENNFVDIMTTFHIIPQPEEIDFF